MLSYVRSLLLRRIMKVTDHLKQANGPIISLEILPPAKGKSIDSIFTLLDPFREFSPAFINVTYHRAEQVFKRRPDGTFERVEIRKRPGTVGICAAIMHRYGVDAVPHLICGGFSKEETENALIDLQFLGIDNVLVLRGDSIKNETNFVPEPDGNKNTLELLEQVLNMNNGIYMDEELAHPTPSSFCIGVSGYPEKHFEAPNMGSDLRWLKQKIDGGADYIV